MKRQKRMILAILALIVALALVTGSVAAKATKTEFAGTTSFGEVIDPGVWTFPGGNVHIRGVVQTAYLVADDPRVTGTETVFGNANLDAFSAGRAWGTSHIEVAYEGGGVWEGTFTAEFYADGSHSVKFVAHGIEGSVEGLKMSGTVVFPADPTAPGISSGIILNPHGD